ncbi:MAG: acyl-CoA thioesterase [Chlorobi bacterium]|nr:acyl-CoA thioesterase [Chlorobiota bacterium]
MITHTTQIRTRYGEVDQMGYVYHANYVSYCHEARTELMRQYGINDKILEENNIMLPVIRFNIDYKNAAHYDDLLTVETTLTEVKGPKMRFEFKITNEQGKIICKACSAVAFVTADTRKPIRVPELVTTALGLQ